MEYGDAAYGVTVVTAIVVGRVNIGTIEVQVVCVVGRVGST